MAVRPLQFPIIAVDKTAKAFNQIRNKLGGLRKAALGVGAAVGGVGIAFGVAIKKTLDFADEIAKTADKVGFSTSALQELRVSLDLAGVSEEQLSTGLMAMSKRIGELRVGTGALKTVLTKMDEEFANQLASTTNNEKAFRLIIKRLGQFTNAQDKAAFMAAIFSRSVGVAMSKLSGKEVDDGIAKARQLGLIIDENLIRNAEVVKDQFELATKVIKTTFMVQILKLMQEVDLTDLADQVKNMAGGFLSAAENVLVFFGVIEKSKRGQLVDLAKELQEANETLAMFQKRVDAGHKRNLRDVQREKKNIEIIQDKIAAIKNLTAVTEKMEKAQAKTSAQNKTLDENAERLKNLKTVMDSGFGHGFDASEMMEQAEAMSKPVEVFAQKLEKSLTPLEQYQESVGSVFNQVQDIGVGAVQTLEDSLIGLIDGTMSAKDAFKSMAKSIIDDLLRMVIRMQITIPIARALNSLLGGFFGGGPTQPFPSGGFDAGAMMPKAAAMGGPVSGGRPYLVGERGPEIMVPGRSGTVIPNHAMGGGVVVNQTLHIETGVAQTVRAEIAQLMPQIADNTKAAVLDARRRGGTFANGFA
jgi:hypothetical protein